MPPVRISRQSFDSLPRHRDSRHRRAPFAFRASDLWLLLALAVGAFPAFASEAQQAGRLHRIGMLYAAAPRGSPVDEAFRQGLRELGWHEGENLSIEFRSAAGRYDRLPELAAELVRIRPDVIFATTEPATRAVRDATATIPIVIAAVDYDLELSGKRLQLVREVVPGASRMAVLFDTVGEPQLKETENLARSSGVRLQLLEVSAPADIDRAISEAARGRAGALIVLASPLTYVERSRITRLAAKHRLPTMSPFSELTDAGGLMSYGASVAETFRQATRYVDKILRGTKPEELPVEQPIRFEMAVNLKTAKALGLTIPQSVLVLADKVIR